MVAVHDVGEGQETKAAEDLCYEIEVLNINVVHEIEPSKQCCNQAKRINYQCKDGRNAVNAHLESAVEPKQKYHFGGKTDGEHCAREEQWQRYGKVSQAQGQQNALRYAVALFGLA